MDNNITFEDFDEFEDQFLEDMEEDFGSYYNAEY